MVIIIKVLNSIGIYGHILFNLGLYLDCIIRTTSRTYNIILRDILCQSNSYVRISKQYCIRYYIEYKICPHLKLYIHMSFQ